MMAETPNYLSTILSSTSTALVPVVTASKLRALVFPASCNPINPGFLPLRGSAKVSH
jgi:hypothetical protein